MRKAMPIARIVLILLAVCGTAAVAQDSVDVTFRYTNGSASAVNVPGEFNGWNNADPAWKMAQENPGVWTKTARLSITLSSAQRIPGAWQYKFFPAGTTGAWPNDPLNHHVNAADNSNSFIITRDPTFYQTLPNQRQPIQTTTTPTISSYIFPKVGAALDTSSIRLIIDGTAIAGLGAFYDPVSHQLSYPVSTPLANGSHTMIILASTAAGGLNADTVSFYTEGGYVQISNQGGYATLSDQRTLYGSVQNLSVGTVRIVRNGTDTVSTEVTAGKFTVPVTLLEGSNSFRALADSSGILVSSSAVTFTRVVNHAPTAVMTFVDAGSAIELRATGSTDPDSGQTATLKFAWGEDPGNPSSVGGIGGTTTSTITVNRPTVQGEYYFSLIATDDDGNSDTTRSFFTAGPTHPIIPSTLATIPQWVREGRMYLMFFKMHTLAGTINAAYPDLNRIAAMGYNIIWVLPVMKNRDPINNGSGPGYNIVDFASIAPEYGTLQDMKDFVARAHQLGMKVILDITPNHTSSSHPFVLDARMFREASQYWSYYQHQIIPYSGPSLGQLSQSITGDGFVYYGAFSDALLNYNWADVDARQYMINVYKYWIRECNVDGYRFDVYWGPFTRTNSPNGGESDMGEPVRQALKHLRPDICILGEAAGTGVGTEQLYADYSGLGGPGGVDVAYDWNLKGYLQDPNIWNLSAGTRVDNLDAKLRNGSGTAGMGFLPGPNSSFLRFLENQDEDRIAYVYGTGGVDAATARARTMPVATAVNLAVGLPEVYAGQEVGRGYGISNLDARRRGVIDFTDPAGQLLMPHYQKLAQIKKQFPCFSSQQMVRVATSVSGVYAYTRPLSSMNGVVVANLDGFPHTANVVLTAGGNPASVLGLADGVSYVATDLYNSNVTQPVVFSRGVDTLVVDLPAFGSAVYVIDNAPHTLALPSLTAVQANASGTSPTSFLLEQNYPNPFNPVTVIRYAIPGARAQGLGTNNVRLVVYDLLGREVATLVNETRQPGTYVVQFDASRLSSGVYFYRLQAGTFVDTKKLILLR